MTEKLIELIKYIVRNARYPIQNYLKHPSHLLKMITWRFLSQPSDQKHIFVIGAPRSGTTLLQTLVASHSLCCTYEGESNLFTWRNIFHKNDHLGLDPDFVEVQMQSSGSLVAFFDACVDRFRNESKGKYFVEKTPQHIRHLSFLTEKFPKSKFVHIHRDGRDCFCSARTAGIPRGEDVKQFADYWRTCVRSRMKASADNNILDVSYEELTASPYQTMKIVMRFIGEELEEGQVDSTTRRNDRRTKQKKFSRLSDEIDTSSQERWKKEMTDEEMQMFASCAADELRYLGYQV